MMIKNLILDTNILHKDYDFRSKDLRKIIKICSLYKVNVCIPQIVIDECLGQYRKAFKTAIGNLETSKRDITRLLNDRYINNFPFDKLIKVVSTREEYYSKVLSDFINDKSIDVIPYCKISHQDVVNKMYDAKYPFINKDMERGYKDFLLTMSVLEHVNGNESVIYTKNVKDYTNKINKDSISSIHADYESENCFVSESLPSIIQKLHEGHSSFKSLKIDSSDLDTFFDEMVVNIIDGILYKDELYGELWFEPEVNKGSIYSQIVDEPTIEQDIDWQQFTVSGKVKIQFTCKFSMSNHEFEMLSEDFYFYEFISSAVKSKGHKLDDEWEYIFHDVKYISIFDFTYDLFEFENNPLEKYDEYALTIYRVN
ncbi:PIN domain-containing protein [Vibrio quintilis]|nr:PIN domain-containing protein [Vibrio quintilis]